MNQIEELEKELKQLKQGLQLANQNIQIYRNNIHSFDQDRQKLIDEIQVLEHNLEQKGNNFERKLKKIIERLPSQIDNKSLSNIKNSIIDKAKCIFKELDIEYKDVYKEDYRNISRCKCQSIFESFFVIGIKNKQLKDLEEKKKVALLKPKFTYKQHRNGVNSVERELLKELEKEIKSKFEQHEILAEKLDYENIKENINSIIYEKISDQTSNNLYFFNLRGFDIVFQIEIPQNMELLTALNKDKQLFVFTLRLDDYITNLGEDKFVFWKTQKFYCFLTYFPIIEIFEKLLIFIAEFIQQSRSIAFFQYQQDLQKKKQRINFRESQEQHFLQKIYQDLDSVNILHLIKKDFSTIIQNLSNLYLKQDNPEFKVDLYNLLQNKSIRINQPTLQYSLTLYKEEKIQKHQISIKNRIQNTHIVLQIFNFNQIFSIFTEILKEGQILFFCENINILTQVCYFFHLILYPFIWTQPVIYNCNQEAIDQLITQNMSFIAGLNQKYRFWGYNERNQQLLQKGKLTIVELIIKTKANNINVTPNIHLSKQTLSPNINQFKEIIRLLELQYSKRDILNRNLTQNSADICYKFLSKIITIIEEEFIQKVIPVADRDFIYCDKLNSELIKSRIVKMIVNHQDKEFIINHIFYSAYFQTYIKNKYNQK